MTKQVLTVSLALVLVAGACFWGVRSAASAAQANLGQVYLAQVVSSARAESGAREYTLHVDALKEDVKGARCMQPTYWVLPEDSQVMIAFANGEATKPLILGPSPWGAGNPGYWLSAPVELGGNQASVKVDDTVKLTGGDAELELGGFPKELSLEANGSKVTIDSTGNMDIYADGSLNIHSWGDLVFEGDDITFKPSDDVIFDCGDDIYFDADDVEVEANKVKLDVYDFEVDGRSHFDPEPWHK